MKVTITTSSPEPTDELLKNRRAQAIVQIAMENLTQAFEERLPHRYSELIQAMETGVGLEQVMRDPIGELLMRAMPIISGEESTLQELRAAPLGDQLIAEIISALSKLPSPKRYLKFEKDWVEKGVHLVIIRKGIQLYLNAHHRSKRPPRGWVRWEGEFIIDKSLRKALTRAVQLRKEGLNFPEIANRLRRERLTRSDGDPLKKDTIRQIIKDEELMREENR